MKDFVSLWPKKSLGDSLGHARWIPRVWRYPLNLQRCCSRGPGRSYQSMAGLFPEEVLLPIASGAVPAGLSSSCLPSLGAVWGCAPPYPPLHWCGSLQCLKNPFWSLYRKPNRETKPQRLFELTWKLSDSTGRCSRWGKTQTRGGEEGNILPNHSLVEDQPQNIAAYVKLCIGWLHEERKESAVDKGTCYCCCWV